MTNCQSWTSTGTNEKQLHKNRSRTMSFNRRASKSCENNRSGGIKQYNPKKVHKWGFKNMVRAGQSGFIYGFFMYVWKHSVGAEKCSVEESVMQLLKEIPMNQNFQVCFNNWFLTLLLLIRLHKIDTLATVTWIWIISNWRVSIYVRQRMENHWSWLFWFLNWSKFIFVVDQVVW